MMCDRFVPQNVFHSDEAYEPSFLTDEDDSGTGPLAEDVFWM